MQPQGEAGRLFAALSSINARALCNDRLLSCQVLAKGPDQGRVLERFLAKAPPLRFGAVRILLLACRYAAANILHFLFLLMTALFARLHGWKRPAPPAPGSPPLLLVDTFALLPRIAAEGRWRDLYLPGLAESAKEQGMRALTLYRLYGSRNPLTLWRAIQALAASSEGMLEAHLFSLSDWLRLVRHMAVYPFSLLRLIESLHSAPSDSPERYIREALLLTAGQCALVGEARRLAGLRLGLWLTKAPAGSRIVSWYENQCVNKAFYRGLRQAQKQNGKRQNTDHVPTIGAQLFLWPPVLLNNHADDAEAALGLAPDRVVVNGPYFLPDASCQNYAIGPSLRYAHLFTGPAPGADAPQTPVAQTKNQPVQGHVLVLLSYHPDETRKVLRLTRDMTLDAARSTAPDAARPQPEQAAQHESKGHPLPQTHAYTMVFRFHPATRPDDFADLLPPDALFSTNPLPQALTLACAVLGAGSGSLAEAAAMGLPVLAVEDSFPESGLNYLPPYGKGFLWESVQNGQDAQSALCALLARLHEPGRDEAVLHFKNLLFTRPTPEAIAAMLHAPAAK